MRIADLIRGFLDIIDAEQQQPKIEISINKDDDRRFNQIKDLLPGGEEPFLSNSPNERYADIDSVTTDAGGGWNGPKDPADIRGEHPSMYPTQQWGFKDYLRNLNK
jgi:hypothetical protein